jgi:hypothetical protein
MTQNAFEILASGDPEVWATQINYEMLFIPVSYDRVTQVVEEVLYLANLGAIQQAAVEAMSDGGDRSALTQQVAVEMMHTIKATAFITAANEEILKGPGEPVNVQGTQTNLEILTLNQIAFFAAAVDQQVAIESVINSNPNGLINHVAVEEINNGTPNARINHDAVETIHNNDRNGRLNQAAIEELGNSTTMAGLTQQVAIEMLVRPEFDGTVGGLVNNPRYHI